MLRHEVSTKQRDLRLNGMEIELVKNVGNLTFSPRSGNLLVCNQAPRLGKLSARQAEQLRGQVWPRTAKPEPKPKPKPTQTRLRVQESSSPGWLSRLHDSFGSSGYSTSYPSSFDQPVKITCPRCYRQVAGSASYCPYCFRVFS
jgi:hypothetical protein